MGRQLDWRRSRIGVRSRTRRLVGIIPVFVGLLCPAEPLNAECLKLPAPVPDRIGRVQLMLGKVPDKSVLAGKYDIVWADYFYKPGWAKVPGIYSMKYMTSSRDPNPYARRSPAGDA